MQQQSDTDAVWAVINNAREKGVTLTEIMEATPLTQKQIVGALKEMQNLGLVERSKEKRRGFFGNRQHVYVSRQMAMFD